MRRLVYSPKAYVYVKSRNGDIYDLSDYVVSGSVSRRIDQVSSANVILRNPDKIFTVKRTSGGVQKPMFYPMDPITIYLERIKGFPVQVFTGFLDTTPYLQLYPGNVELIASCTLKRLQYTFFDPGLPFTQQFLASYGWSPQPGGGEFFSSQAFDDFTKEGNAPSKTAKDGSYAELLNATLKYMGHWAPDEIWVEPMPAGVFDRIARLSDEFAKDNEEALKEVRKFAKKLVGQGGYGSPDGLMKPGTVDSKGLSIAPNFPIEVSGGWTLQGQAKSSPETSNYNANSPAIASTNAEYNNGWWALRAPNGNAAVIKQTATTAATGPENFDINIQAYSVFGYSTSDDINTNEGKWRGKYFGKGDDSKKAAARFLSENKDTGDSNVDATGPAGPQGNTDSTGRSTLKGGTNKDPYNYVFPFVKDENYSIAQKNPNNGVVIKASAGASFMAIGDGQIVKNNNSGTGANAILLKLDKPINGKTFVYYGFAGQTGRRSPGEKVSKGEYIGTVGETTKDPRLQIGFADSNGSPIVNSSGDMLSVLNNTEGRALISGTQTKDGVVIGPNGEVRGPSIAGAMFFGSLELQGVFNLAESSLLGGEKSLLNDKPLLPFVQQLCNASLRHFQSLPDGRFFAFYPDYFGEMGAHPPYWEIDDIEILDGKINLTDDSLVTHMYVVGDTISPMGGIPMGIRALASSGVVTVYNMFMANNVLSKSEKEAGKTGDSLIKMQREDAAAFLKRYGARPVVEDMPMIRSRYYEMFLAYQKFLLGWSKQFSTPFTFTFMPELYPGGKVGFPDHSIQMYIEQVDHSWDYENGFTTTASLTAPSTYTNSKTAEADLLPEKFVNAIIDVAKESAKYSDKSDGIRGSGSQVWDPNKGKANP